MTDQTTLEPTKPPSAIETYKEEIEKILASEYEEGVQYSMIGLIQTWLSVADLDELGNFSEWLRVKLFRQEDEAKRAIVYVLFMHATERCRYFVQDISDEDFYFLLALDKLGVTKYRYFFRTYVRLPSEAGDDQLGKAHFHLPDELIDQIHRLESNGLIVNRMSHIEISPRGRAFMQKHLQDKLLAGF